MWKKKSVYERCCRNKVYYRYHTWKKVKVHLTYGAVGPCPVGVADACSRVGVEGAVAGALFRTSVLENLAADPSPSWVAVALTVMASPMTRALWVHTIHWGRQRQSVYHLSTGYRSCLFTPVHFDSASSQKINFWEEVLRSQMVAGEPRPNRSHCLLAAGNFSPNFPHAPVHPVCTCNWQHNYALL